MGSLRRYSSTLRILSANCRYFVRTDTTLFESPQALQNELEGVVVDGDPGRFGAFEVSVCLQAVQLRPNGFACCLQIAVDDVVVFSKLKTGEFPIVDELIATITAAGLIHSETDESTHD